MEEEEEEASDVRGLPLLLLVGLLLLPFFDAEEDENGLLEMSSTCM